MNLLSRVIARSDERATLFSRMIDALNVDIVSASGANEMATASAIRGCLSCCASAECRRFLDGEGAATACEAPAFCTNRDLIRSMPRRS